MEITKKEIEALAKKYDKTYEEMESDIEIFLNELKQTQKGIEDTIVKNGYIRFPDNLNIFGYGENNELNDKYICYTPNIKKILQKDKKDIAIVSGFGATNTPTMGTLSMMLKLIEFQKKTGLYTYCIINDLGSLNARNIDLEYVLELTDSFKQFLNKIGFDNSNGEIRTHNDIDHARTFSIVSSAVKLDDFVYNGEATDDTYKRLNLKGNDFSVLVDHVYTATDVLLPILKDGKSGIIVPCGLEEFYHANIGGIALGRIMQDKTLSKLVPEDVEVGAVYSKLVSGFFPYFKQSKSIPNSSLNLGDTRKEIYGKIISCTERDEQVVMDMIASSTPFKPSFIQEAREAFENRVKDYEAWLKYKFIFAEYIIGVKDIWDSCKPAESNIRKRIYG